MKRPALVHLLPWLFGLVATLLSNTAFAHEGHGLSGASHWHSSDVWGFVALGVVSLAAWFGDRP